VKAEEEVSEPSWRFGAIRAAPDGSGEILERGHGAVQLRRSADIRNLTNP
jgi:hypothetical protein